MTVATPLLRVVTTTLLPYPAATSGVCNWSHSMQLSSQTSSRTIKSFWSPGLSFSLSWSKCRLLLWNQKGLQNQTHVFKGEVFLHSLIVVEELSHCGLACAACQIWTTFTASGEANLSKRIWREVERKAPPTKASAMSFSMQTRNERHRRSTSDPIISPQTFVGTRFYPQRILITYNKVVYVSLLLHTQKRLMPLRTDNHKWFIGLAM